MFLTLLVLAAIAGVGQLLALLAVWNNWRHTVDIDGDGNHPPATDLPALLVVVPARDEAGNIGGCLEALRASRYPRLRLRVVDDSSRDGTAEVARAQAAVDERVEVLDAGELPAGWRGKTHALQRGTRDLPTDVEWLLFVDADVRVGPDCLARAVDAARRLEADLLSVLPATVAVGAWELAAQVLMVQLILASLPSREVNDPRHPRAAAWGPVMLFRRRAYEQLGGHAAVRGEVAEDLRLAEAVKRAGLRLVLARGIGHARLRMYDSLGAIVRGWSKNAGLALDGALWSAPLLAAAVVLLFAGPWLLPLAAIPLALTTASPTPLALPLAATVLAVLGRLDLARRYGVPARHPWLAPLGALVVTRILVGAAWRLWRGARFEWKGRPV